MLRFFAVLLTGLALIAPGAHVYEIANKLPLPKAEYFIVQKIYIGWWIAGLLLPASSAGQSCVGLRGTQCACAYGSVSSLGKSRDLLFFFTYPVNVTTENWTIIPGDWEALRRQ